MAEDGTCSWSSCVCIRWGRTQPELIAFARTNTRGNHAMRLTSLLLLLLGVSVPAASAQTQQGTTQDGESLYAERCAKCHESGVPRAANREGLRRLSPDAIRLALTTGTMRTQGAELTPAQIDILARLLGTRASGRGFGIRRQRLRGEPCFLLRECARSPPVERVGRQPVAAPIPAGRRGAAAGRSGSAAETEVGVRIPWREPRVCSAHRRRRAGVRRQRQWNRVLAERR